MRAAGVRQIGGPVTELELPRPRRPGTGEVLLDVQASGAGNWDEFVRTGGWDTGIRPPMALGVEAAGTPASGRRWRWASRRLGHRHPAADGAGRRGGWAGGRHRGWRGRDRGGGEAVLIHGAGGVTGQLLVQLAVRQAAG